MNRMIDEEMIKQFEAHLKEEERSTNTIKKYLRDIRKFKEYVKEAEVTKSLVVSYKKSLLADRKYEVSSVNSFLTAVNRFFEFMEWYDVRVKIYRVQRNQFASEKKQLNRNEYEKLVNTARKSGKHRLAMILNTICATGIRISELEAFTVESVKNGKVVIYNKGKIRTILMPTKLQIELLKYINQMQIGQGVLFCTKSGKPINRSNIWKEMKALCIEAHVDEEKVFPHNLRHLFAQSFYAVKHDLAKLADVLGHESIETTRIYIRTTSKEILKQMEELRLVC